MAAAFHIPGPEQAQAGTLPPSALPAAPPTKAGCTPAHVPCSSHLASCSAGEVVVRGPADRQAVNCAPLLDRARHSMLLGSGVPEACRDVGQLQERRRMHYGIDRATSLPDTHLSGAPQSSLMNGRTSSLRLVPFHSSPAALGEVAQGLLPTVISRSCSLPQSPSSPVKSSLKKFSSFSNSKTVHFKESVTVRRFRHRMDTPGMIVPVLTEKPL